MASWIESLICQIPKVELHVHLEGGIQPETLFALAQRNHITLPVNTAEGLRQWYCFKDFKQFIQIYLTISDCIRTPDDIEFIAREFLRKQAEQNIRYTEVTYSASTHHRLKKISFRDQLQALNRARAWAEKELHVSAAWIIDIVRNSTPDEGMMVADWAISGMEDGVVALGLGGPEADNPPEKFSKAFKRAREAGLAAVPHAGETVGPKSIWGAIKELHAVRIGHGVRCLEDPKLVAELRKRQIPLEVCSTSNVCLGVVKSFSQVHFPYLLKEGLYVTVNSDDPGIFGSTLTEEYLALAKTFELEAEQLVKLVLNSVHAALLSVAAKKELEAVYRHEIKRLLSKDDVLATKRHKKQKANK